MEREWEAEPKELDFADEATGLACYMRRGPGGHWCGYVALPDGHPLYGKSYGDPVTTPAGYMDRPVTMDEDYGAISVLTASLVAKPDENVWPSTWPSGVTAASRTSLSATAAGGSGSTAPTLATCARSSPATTT